MEKWYLVASLACTIIMICIIAIMNISFNDDLYYGKGGNNMIMIRYNEPAQDNPYYIRKADGGWNTAIEGYPVDGNLTALSNCVGYSIGRYNEQIGQRNCDMLRPSAACSFVKYAKQDGIKTGRTPKIGAVICWSGGGGDNDGHVAVVEQILSPTKIICSESVYGGTPFRRRTYTRGKFGKWGVDQLGELYKFEGFVYNPAVGNDDVLALRKMIANGTATLSYDFNGDGIANMKDVLILRKSIY